MKNTSILLRGIPADLWRQVKSRAALEGITLNKLLLRLLERYVKENS